MAREDDNYVDRINNDLKIKCPKYWRRFGGSPDFDGLNVLEIGCGLGALSIDMAQKGAANVLGIDILPNKIELASRYVEEHLPELANRIQFSCEPMSELRGREFDLVVSKDAFEHILDVPGMLADIESTLADAGKVYIGFSPLYHSPFGDHDRRRKAFADWGLFGKLLAKLPWGHMFLEPLILRMHPVTRGQPSASIQNLSLNAMAIGEFRNYIRSADLVPNVFYVNQGDSIIGRMLSVFRRVPVLEKYCSYNIYCVLGRSTVAALGNNHAHDRHDLEEVAA